MKLIAHRGLMNGPNSTTENSITQIMLALRYGFDVEIDVRYENNAWWLGHDAPQWQVDYEFLTNSSLWIHAKNLDALSILSNTNLNYFYHQTDDFTLTSHHYIWTYPGKDLVANSVMVLPEKVNSNLSNVRNARCFGICSDFVSELV